jgi:hypothetical protein
VAVVVLEVAPIVPMVNTNIPILVRSVHIVVQLLLVALLTAHLESTSMNLGKVNVVIVDQVLMEVVRIVHLENMNISIKGGEITYLLSKNHS